MRFFFSLFILILSLSEASASAPLDYATRSTDVVSARERRTGCALRLLAVGGLSVGLIIGSVSILHRYRFYQSSLPRMIESDGHLVSEDVLSSASLRKQILKSSLPTISAPTTSTPADVFFVKFNLPLEQPGFEIPLKAYEISADGSQLTEVKDLFWAESPVQWPRNINISVRQTTDSFSDSLGTFLVVLDPLPLDSAVPFYKTSPQGIYAVKLQRFQSAKSSLPNPSK